MNEKINPVALLISLGILALVLGGLSACEQNYGISVSSAASGSSATGGSGSTGPPGATPFPTGLPTLPPSVNPGAPPTLPPVTTPNGAIGGHFDVDTAAALMPYISGNAPGDGTVSGHVHEYDKVNNTTTVDFFNLSTANVEHVASKNSTYINLNSLNVNQRFYLIVVNSTLNPGAMLQINGGVPVFGTAYQANQQTILGTGGKPQAYTIGPPTTPGDLQLTDLIIAIAANIQVNNQLLPTAPKKCVFPNINGYQGEYRDGAFVVQAVDPATFAQNPANGAAEAPSGGMLWEGVIYNHFMLLDGQGRETDPEYCYGSTVNGQIFY